MVAESFAWVGEIAAWFGQWFPRWEILDTTMGAVKFKWGKKPVALGPGWHIYWPFSTEFKSYPTARTTLDCRPQTLVTSDDQNIAVSAIIVYEVTDVLPLLAHTYEPDDAVADLTISAVSDVLSCLAWADIRALQQSGRLDIELRRAAAKHFKQFGVKVHRVTLSDLVKRPHTIRMLQNVTSVVGEE